MDLWNPEQYARFKSERSRPFFDLVKNIKFEDVHSMLDVGCGTGELTQGVHVSHQLARTVGIDTSAKMLEESKKHAARGLTFTLASAETYIPAAQFDLVLSNAALQWIDRHKELFARLVSWLAPRGQLAVQMPLNFDHPSHKIAEVVAPHFGLKPREMPVIAPEDYAKLLWDLGLTEIDVTTKIYLHPMPDSLEVVEWTKGTLLTHYQKQLSPQRYAEFLKMYTSELTRILGQGTYLYTFKRLFLYGRKA